MYLVVLERVLSLPKNIQSKIFKLKICALVTKVVIPVRGPCEQTQTSRSCKDIFYMFQYLSDLKTKESQNIIEFGIMERVVRNNTRKSSLFKIQAQKSKFEDHFADFGCCKLLENHPECANYEEYLKEITEVFIKYSFDANADSPFFQAMNYKGRYCGFSNDSCSFTYREWLPNIKQAFLEGPCNKGTPRQFELTSSGNEFFDLTVRQHFETFSDGDTVRLILIDKHGNQYKCPPPSARRLTYDPNTKEFLGIFGKTHKTKAQDSSASSSFLLGFEMDIHKESLATWLGEVPNIVKCQFNTVIIKNLFDYKDKSIEAPLLNKYSLKLTSDELETLQDIIEKLKEEQIKVLFEIDFFHEPYHIKNSLEEGYLIEKAPFQFNIKNSTVQPFLLATLSYFMTHYEIDGFKFSNIDRALLKGECLSKYQQPCSFSKTFIEDCSKESILFTKLINMVIERNNSNFISYCSSNCLIPGAYIKLDEGGFGFTFASQESRKHHKSFSQKNISLMEEKSIQLFHNVVCYWSKLQTPQEELNVIIEYLWSPNGAVCMEPAVITEGNESKFELLESIMHFRDQGQYFVEQATTGKDLVHDKSVICFTRNKYVFIINTDQHDQEIVFTNSRPAETIYSSKSNEVENIKITFENGQLNVVIPSQTAIVLEKDKIS